MAIVLFASIMLAGITNKIRKILYERIEVCKEVVLCAFSAPYHCSWQARWCRRRLGRWCVGFGAGAVIGRGVSVGVGSHVCIV